MPPMTADLLLAFDAFDDRVTGKVEKFCEHGTIIHMDAIDMLRSISTFVPDPSQRQGCPGPLESIAGSRWAEAG